jgi:hypothetical protein
VAKKREKVTNLVNALLDVEKGFWDLCLDFVPDDARQHLRASRKEKLLALRSILDARIENIDREGKDGKKKPQKVKVN